MERGAIPDGSPTETVPEQSHDPSPCAVRGALGFSPAEHVVLEALEGAASLTAGQLRVRTGLTPDDLALALESLRAKGVVAALNTVVESYRSRFPGVSLDPE